MSLGLAAGKAWDQRRPITGSHPLGQKDWPQGGHMIRGLPWVFPPVKIKSGNNNGIESVSFNASPKSVSPFVSVFCCFPNHTSPKAGRVQQAPPGTQGDTEAWREAVTHSLPKSPVLLGPREVASHGDRCVTLFCADCSSEDPPAVSFAVAEQRGPVRTPSAPPTSGSPPHPPRLPPLCSAGPGCCGLVL